MTTLVSLLGRARKHPEKGYRNANYQFPDGSRRESSFFGLVLAEYLAVDRLVILGTAGSMWELFVEHLAEGDAQEVDRPALLESAEKEAVTEEQLARLQPLAEEALGRRVELMLIPYARDLDEQEALLDRLAEVVRGERSLHFDVTHGLRHLPMLSLVAAHLLEALSNNLRVEGIWYGALDLTREGITPVLQLQGLMRLQDWIEAWRHFEETGDYGAFVPLLEREGLPRDKVEALRRAAHFERLLNLPDARRQLQNFLPVLDDPLPGAASLFGKRLRDRLKWARHGALYQQQRAQALLHLRKGDYLRAAILAVEAVLTRRMEKQGEGDPNRYEDRQRVREALEKELKEAQRDDYLADFRRLNRLRNALAHGTAPGNRHILDLLHNPERLEKELERIISRLLT